MARHLRHPCLAALAALPAVVLAVFLAAGCGKRALPGYGPDETARAPEAAAANATMVDDGHGLVDVICLPGTGKARGVPDSLFNCLLHARDTGLGTVELPRGVYLGHVSEFIVRALKFYEIEAHFERFYGYRVVLRLHPATEDEAGEARRGGYLRTALGAAGDAGLYLAGMAWMPLTPMVFLFETADMDAQRQRWAEDAERAGLPPPTRSSGGVVLDQYKRRYAMLLGAEGEAAMQAWVVDECYLEKPDAGEIVTLATQWDAASPRGGTGGGDFPSQGQ